LFKLPENKPKEFVTGFLKIYPGDQNLLKFFESAKKFQDEIDGIQRKTKSDVNSRGLMFFHRSINNTLMNRSVEESQQNILIPNISRGHISKKSIVISGS